MKAKKTIYDLQRESPVSLSQSLMAEIISGISKKDYHLNKAGGSLSFKGKTVSVMISFGRHVGFLIMPEEVLKDND